MPTYEYACQGCGHRFETQQRITAEPLSVCPRCGGALRRLPGGGGGILIRGSGQAHRPDCGQSQPCCGRSTRCEKPPSGER